MDTRNDEYVQDKLSRFDEILNSEVDAGSLIEKDIIALGLRKKDEDATPEHFDPTEDTQHQTPIYCETDCNKCNTPVGPEHERCPECWGPIDDSH